MHYRGKNRHNSGNRHCSTCCHCWFLPSVPKRFHTQYSGHPALPIRRIEGLLSYADCSDPAATKHRTEIYVITSYCTDSAGSFDAPPSTHPPNIPYRAHFPNVGPHLLQERLNVMGEPTAEIACTAAQAGEKAGRQAGQSTGASRGCLSV